MKHAILILAHRNLSHLLRLINSFQGRFYIFVHVDKACFFKDKDVEAISSQPGVVSVYRKYDVHWAGFSMLKCELDLLNKALKECDADYFHLMSGQDYLIKSITQFEDFFNRNQGKDFLDYKPYPSPDWDHGTYHRIQYFMMYDHFDARSSRGGKILSKSIEWQKRLGIQRRVPTHFDRLYGGSQWFSLTRDCATYLVASPRKYSAFYRRMNFTFAPEEIYVHTVLLNSPFGSNILNENCRYILWKKENGSLPANLGSHRFFDLITSKALIARKFENAASSELIEWIDRYIHTAEKVKKASNGFWTHQSLKGHCYDNGLAEAMIRVCQLAELDSVVEFGCGPGWYVAALRRARIPIMGYDGNPHTEDFSRLILGNDYPCGVADLTEDLVSEDDPFDMVICLDVGAHIPVEYEAQLIRNIVHNAGKYIILSWTLPGQEEDGHFNPHTNEYVIRKFAEQGFSENEFAKNYLREQSDLQRFKETLFVFQRDTAKTASKGAFPVVAEEVAV